MAASAQAVRFMLQKHLKSTKLSTAGATFARFIYSAPLVAVIAVFYAFKKTEVILAAIVGLIVLGDRVGVLVVVAIIIGLVGVLLLSDPPKAEGAWHQRIFNKAAGLGLLSGLLFAVSGVGYRGASLSLGHGDVFYRAIITLAIVTAFQVAVMAVWLAVRERDEIARVLAAWRVAGLVGITSMIGSIGWFTAFTMQTVALVKAVGQIELVLSLLASVLVFGETIGRREWQGLLLIAVSVILLVVVS